MKWVLTYHELLTDTGKLKGNDMDKKAVIERLMESKRSEEVESRNSGFHFGKEWAEKTASYGELSRAVDLANHESLAAPLLAEEYMGASPASQNVAMYICTPGGIGSAKEDIKEFWTQVVGEDAIEELGMDEITADFCQGFIDGAKDSYDAVADEINEEVMYR